MTIKNGLVEDHRGSVSYDIETEIIIDDEGNEFDGDEFVQIYTLFVAPEFRGCGVARKLMNIAIGKITADYPGLEIKIVPQPKDESVDLERLADFYESLGLTVVAV